MTQPFDPLNPPNAAIGVRAGMFGDSTRCPNPTCGFASSDQSIFECPSCGTVWRKRPEKKQEVTTTPAGTRIALACVMCGKDFSSGVPVFDGAGGLAHESCLLADASAVQRIAVEASEAPDYLSIVADERVIPAEKKDEAPKPKKKRRRRRKKPGSRPSQPQQEALFPAPEGK